MSIRQKLQKISNQFINCSEVSAQECCYTLLGMSVSRSSREVMFVNTYPKNERSRILLEKRVLEMMLPTAKNIYKRGIIDHYVKRPDSMKDMCLAEFAGCFDYVSNEEHK
jgi:hypothetical protein